MRGVTDQDSRPLFRAEDMFVITNKGTYVLQVQMRIAVPMTNGIPDCEAMVDTHKFFNSNLGIVTSAPVRVQIIKE